MLIFTPKLQSILNMKNLPFEEFHISIDYFTPPPFFQCTQIGENFLLFDGVNIPKIHTLIGF